MFDDFNELTTLLIPEGDTLVWWSKEHQLWYSVLEQGLERYQTLLSKPIHKTREKRELEELTNWFFNNNTQWIGSFLTICDNCKISSVRIRKGIRIWLENRVIQGE